MFHKKQSHKKSSSFPGREGTERRGGNTEAEKEKREKREILRLEEGEMQNLPLFLCLFFSSLSSHGRILETEIIRPVAGLGVLEHDAV